MDHRIPIQSPPTWTFSSADLHWNESGIAHIPFHRLVDFQDGEGRRTLSMETTFYIRDSKRTPPPMSRWQLRLTMWCAYGPFDVPAPMVPAVPPRKGTFPASGLGSRPRARKSDYNNHMKRGCQCHYKVTQFKDNLEFAVIEFQNRDHVNKAGNQCHGSIKETSIDKPDWSIRCQVAPRLSNELKKHLMDLLRAGMSVLAIHDLHCAQQVNRVGPDADLNCTTLVPLNTLDGRDDLLDKRDLYNLKVHVQKERTRLHDNDVISIQKWIDGNQERVLIHRQYQIGPPEVEFILALQSPWQIAQMIELSHQRALALDSTFATNKYGFPFFTLVCFDRHQMGLPAAWSIQIRETANMICLFLEAVKERAKKISPDWMPSCFIIDCAEAEVNALEIVFPGIPIYFCSWHVRRAWKDNLIKKVSDRTHIREMGDDLGDIMYADNEDQMWDTWLRYCKKYQDETTFLKYFKEEWLSKPEKWMRAVRTMSRANQNTNGCTEAWHLTLKTMIARLIGGLHARRLDELVPMLFGPMLAFFMYNMKRKQLGRMINYKVEDIVLSSLQLAEHELKNAKVSFPDPSTPDRALVESVKTSGKQYEVRNIYSHFPSCECQWAEQGNMCKHQVKALLVRGHAGGTIVQQLGTRFGSEFHGLTPNDDPLSVEDEQAKLATCEMALLQLHAQPGVDCDDLPVLNLEQEEDLCDIALHGDDNVFAPTQSSTPEMNRSVLDELVAQITEMVSGNDQLFQNAVVGMKQTMSTLTQITQSQTISGKDVICTNDRFVRPLGLTSKRRLGVVDLYHGANRRKRTATENRKKKTGTQEAPVTPCTSVEEVEAQHGHEVRDPLPPRQVVLRRETFREELNRHGHAAVTGTSARRSAKNQPGNIYLPPPNSITHGRRLRTESSQTPEDIDLNVNNE